MPIIWKDFKTWDPLIREVLTRDLAPGIVVKIQERDTSSYGPDSWDWRDLLAEISGIPLEKLASDLARKLSASRLRVYHGCRPVDINSYLTNGIRILRQEDFVKEMREFINADPRLAGVDLDKKLKEYPREYDQGKSFLTFDDRMMIEWAGHYLIYGSEWKAVLLGRSNWGILLEQGTPTMLLIDLPGSFVPENILEQFARDLLLEWTRHIARPADPVNLKDHGVELERDLEPKYIVGHEHPIQLKDPWNERKFYSVINLCCPNE